MRSLELYSDLGVTLIGSVRSHLGASGRTFDERWQVAKTADVAVRSLLFTKVPRVPIDKSLRELVKRDRVSILPVRHWNKTGRTTNYGWRECTRRQRVAQWGSGRMSTQHNSQPFSCLSLFWALTSHPERFGIWSRSFAFRHYSNHSNTQTIAFLSLFDPIQSNLPSMF